MKVKDPIAQVKQRLRALGATYIGGLGHGKKGSQWELPGGVRYVLERRSVISSQDVKRSMRELDELLKSQEADTLQENLVETEIQVEKLDVPPSSSVKERWTNAVEQTQRAQDRLLKESDLLDRRKKMLEAISPFTEDPFFEDVLKSIVPNLNLSAVEKESLPSPVVVNLPEPPQKIEEHVQVTRNLVYAAIQTFDSPFTVNDLVKRMVNNAKPSNTEWMRIRSSIASAIYYFRGEGQLRKEEDMKRGRQTLWVKVNQVRWTEDLKMEEHVEEHQTQE